MASLHRGAAPPSDLPALLIDMILGACLKRSRQLEAQQEQEHEVGGPSRRAGSLLGRPQVPSDLVLLLLLCFELAAALQTGA
jgi:hypothetical protein